MSTTNIITDSMPNDWHDLEAQVGRILQECGLTVEIGKTIETVRGTTNVDVYAEDTTQKPTTVYVCECKRWASTVPKTVVHAFRTVLSDCGANWGLLISSEGFQSGAFAAAASSNVRLLSWTEFQTLFVDRWTEHYMLPRLREEAEPLVDYTEPVNSRIFRKADALTPELQNEFGKLRDQYQVLAFLALHLYISPLYARQSLPELPLKTGVRPEHMNIDGGLPPDLLEATSLRQFLDIMCQHIQTGLAAFDRVFGECA